MAVIAVPAMMPGTAEAALKFWTLRWTPSTSSGVTKYVVSIGFTTRSYSREVDLGLPTPINGVMERVVALEDAGDNYLALRAANASLYSQYSNEVVVLRAGATGSTPLPDPEPPPGSDPTSPAPDFTATPFDPAHDVIGLVGEAGGQISLVDVLGRVTPLIVHPNPGSADLRPAWCDVDGDGSDDLVIGFGHGGRGELLILIAGNGRIAASRTVSIGSAYQWTTETKQVVRYVDANGETWPACGDVDGDGRNEIVTGLGAGPMFKIHVFDDMASGFAPMWPTGSLLPIAFGGLRSLAGSAIPALGDVDGDGRAEIVIGRSAGGDGRLAVFDDATTGFLPLRSDYDIGTSSRVGFSLSVVDPSTTDGAVYPTVANIDGGAASEILVGSGAGSAGLVRGFDDSAAGYKRLRLTPLGETVLSTGWPSYTQANGTARPVLADLDGDGAAELVVGFGLGGEGRIEIFDNQGARFVVLPALSATGGLVDTQRNLIVAPAPRPW